MPETPTRPLARSRAADDIFQILHADIVAGRLLPGARMPSEKELAVQFGVSGPTVREAIRGLTLIGLAEARHGSGTYVTTDTAQLVALLFGTMISLDRIGAREVLDVLGSLNELAAISAAQWANEAELAAIRDTLATFGPIASTEEAAEAVRVFHGAIAAGSHNPLLETLCRFLTGIQVQLASTLAGGSVDLWRSIFASLASARADLVNAIVARDPAAAGACARHFGQAALRLVVDLPDAQAVRIRDPNFSALLATLLAGRGPAQ